MKNTLYMRLYAELKEKIQSGALPEGSRLPSKRSLSQSMGISVNTVDAAYSQLCDEGFVKSQQRKGYFVCALDPLAPTPGNREEPRQAPRQVSEIAVDFSPSGFARELFPFSTWRRLTRDCLDQSDPELLKRSPPQGDEALRRAIAAYIWNARGVNADFERIVVGTGSNDLMNMLAFILDRDCSLAVENPVYNRAYRFWENAGHKVIPVDVDRQGIPVEPLEELSSALVYTTPSHQYPLGFSMPIARRIKLLNWAAAGDFRYIIEDDYDSEFRYGGRPIPSLSSIASGERVIYMGTFSRSVAPALRIAYMVLPEQLMELYKARWTDFPSSVSGIDQRVLAAFMTGGHFERHLNRLRLHYKNRRTQLMEALSPFERRLKIVGDNAGHHLTVKLAGMSESKMCGRALKSGVKVYPVSHYFIGETDKIYESKVLLGFGGLSDGEAEKGAELLLKAWS